jgi:Zn finger protein HypA/HybF involved in hydrogenase expression
MCMSKRGNMNIMYGHNIALLTNNGRCKCNGCDHSYVKDCRKHKCNCCTDSGAILM